MHRFDFAARPFRLRALSVALAAASSAVAVAQTPAPEVSTQRDYDLPAGALATTLNRIAVDAGLALSVEPALVQGKRAPAVRGRFDAATALREALRGSGLQLLRTPAGSYTLEALPDGAAMLQKVRVEAAPSLLDAPVERGGIKADYQSSATKMPMSLKETPQSVSVITRKSIDARQAVDVLSALELAAGVSAGVSSGGGPFAGPSPRVAEQFSLRGQRLNGDRDVRIDGFAAGAQRNEFDLAAFERVEVVKGPSSMMYGQGSVGGFINLIQKKPQKDFAGSISGSVGSYDTYRGEVDVTGALDAGGNVSGRIAAAYDDRGSFIDDVESRRTVVAPSLSVDLGERTRLLLTGMLQDTDSLPSLGIPLRLEGDRLKVPDIKRSFYFGVQAAKESETTESMATLKLDRELDDDWLATLLLQRSSNDRHGYADSYGYGIYGDGDTYLYAASTIHETDVWAGELRVNGRFQAFGREHQLMAGVETNEREQDAFGGYAYVGTANIYRNDFADAGTVRSDQLPITYDFTDTSRNRAAYLQFQLALTERIKLLTGARYDRAEQVSRNHIDGGGDSAKESEITYRIGLTGEITSQLNGYVSYGQSFNPVLDRSASGNILDPERGEGYELGLKGEWFDGALAASLALFRQELDNRPIPDPDNAPGQFFSISGGLQRTDGVEIELTGSPLTGLTISAALTLLDAEYIDRRDPNYGLTPQETTDRQSALYVNYEIQNGPLRRLALGGTWVYVDDRWSISGGDNVTVAGYDRVDLQAQYPLTSNLDVSMQVRNVADSRYIERNNGPYGYGHYFGSPRACLLRVEYRL